MNIFSNGAANNSFLTHIFHFSILMSNRNERDANMLNRVFKICTILPALALAGLSACSVGMEASRPTPVDISQFKAGAQRLDVVSKLGAPEGNITVSTGPCDIYQLYTTGLGGFGKGVVTGTEVLTDIGTLGLAEIIWSPAQAMTRPEKRTVLFCYAGDKLVSVTVNGNQRVGSLPTSPTSTRTRAATGATPAG